MQTKHPTTDVSGCGAAAASSITFKAGTRECKIGFSDQKLTAHAGTAGFWAWLWSTPLIALITELLPQAKPRSNNNIQPRTKFLALLQGLLCGMQRVAHAGYLRHDPLHAELLDAKRLPSQSVLSRFLGGFRSAAANLAVFDPLWRWCLAQLPSRKGGYALDLDSTRLLHEDGHQEGVLTGYTRMGTKPCLHPLLAVLSEVKLIAGFWLRSGNCACANNAAAFFRSLWERLPAQVRLRVVRADSGFCVPELLELWEQLQLPFIVVGRLTTHIKFLLRSGMEWRQSGIKGTEVSELWHREGAWKKERRLILVRHTVAEKKRPGGKKLLETPGYLYQVLVTSHPAHTHSPLAVWREYNGRADCENAIKELDHGFGLAGFCCHKFWATEALLSTVVLASNLVTLFERKLGWTPRATVRSLRYWMFTTPGVVVQRAARTVLHLAVPPALRDWWRTLWEKITSPWPNCNAVGTRPGWAR
jgi:hypothetical protein